MEGVAVLKEIQLENFRSLKCTGLQKLSSINLLVGENSSGKSSFLRAFPLLKQSINKRTSGPILWSGDIDDYVDFGSFEETVTNDNSKSISFKFGFSVDLMKRRQYYSLLSHEAKQDEIVFCFSVKTEKSKDYVSNFSLAINEFKVDFDLEKNAIFLNKKCIFKSDKESDEYVLKSQFIPRRFFNAKCRAFGFDLPNIKDLWDVLDETIKSTKLIKNESEMFRFDVDDFVFYAGIELLREKNIQNLLSDKYVEYFKSYSSESASIYKALIKKLSEENEFEDIVKICYLYMVFSVIDDYIINYFKNVHYIAPLRATAERYYRLRNLAVDEVDYQGKNLAVFINSLSPKQLKSFNNWTTKHFGFHINTDKSKGHLSLLIKLENSEKAINLSDTGFGYSQVLPIITQLWEISSRAPVRESYYPFTLTPLVIAIEQPELHLHPAVQAKLVRAFIASIKLAKENGYQLQLLLETHSETIVSQLGHAVSKGVLDSDDVSVVLFEKDKDKSNTIVRNSGFDKDGYLLNWPYGFFEPEE